MSTNSFKQSLPPQPPSWDGLAGGCARLLTWLAIFSGFYVLRSFFLLIFLTFVFAYIQTNAVARLRSLVRNRIVRVLLVEIVVLATITLLMVFLVPKAKTQTQLFIKNLGTYVQRADQELLRWSASYPFVAEMLMAAPEQDSPAPEAADGGGGGKKYSPIGSLAQQLLSEPEKAKSHEGLSPVLSTIGNIGGRIASVTSSFLLALLFSFMIVLDLPSLTNGVRSLKHTKLRFVYLSVATSIRDFARVLGRALEAQLSIALINSLLTSVGIFLLGIGEHLAFLSVIVFFCSFVPVVGVFVSSVPICLIALQVSGVNTMLLAILMITVIHLIEGYILNPRIYGSYMRINPLIILVILTIAGKLFGLWGLLLGVPVCTHIFAYAIRNQSSPEIRPLQEDTEQKEQ